MILINVKKISVNNNKKRDLVNVIEEFIKIIKIFNFVVKTYIDKKFIFVKRKKKFLILLKSF